MSSHDHHQHPSMSDNGNMPSVGMDHSGMDHSAMNHTEMNDMCANMCMNMCTNHTAMSMMCMNHTMGHSGMGHSGMDHGMGHMMKMYFHDGYEEYVLFEDLFTKTKGAMAGACIVIFIIAILYEGLKVFREHLLQRHLMNRGPGAQYQVKGGTSQEQIVMQSQDMSISSRMLSCGHFVQTVLHIVQVFVSYCLMLVFMTYNVWLCLAVVLGAGVGYFLFGWRRAAVVDSNEHCH